MSKSPTPSPRKSADRKARAFTTATIVSFSLTILAASIAILSGLVPLKPMSFAERIDVGSLLFVAPIVALVLAIVFEVTRIALTRPDLPEPRRQQAVRWSPGRREG
jgi:uncharacterized membrane protein